MIDRIIVTASYFMVGLSLSILSILGYSKAFNTPLYTHPDFKPYLEMFKKDAKKFKTPIDLYKLTTVFSNSIPLGTLAYCLPSTNTVVVSTQYWEYLSDQSRKTLLYHEWGHCALKREHVEDSQLVYQSCPVSIMFPYMNPVDRCYSELEDEYLEELFTNPYNYPKISRRD